MNKFSKKSLAVVLTLMATGCSWGAKEEVVLTQGNVPSAQYELNVLQPIEGQVAVAAPAIEMPMVSAPTVAVAAPTMHVQAPVVELPSVVAPVVSTSAVSSSCGTSTSPCLGDATIVSRKVYRVTPGAPVPYELNGSQAITTTTSAVPAVSVEPIKVEVK